MVLAFRCVGVGSLRVFCLRFVGDLCLVVALRVWLVVLTLLGVCMSVWADLGR